MDWNGRLHAAIDYLESRLEEDIDMDQAAAPPRVIDIALHYGAPELEVYPRNEGSKADINGPDYVCEVWIPVRRRQK